MTDRVADFESIDFKKWVHSVMVLLRAGVSAPELINILKSMEPLLHAQPREERVLLKRNSFFCFRDD